MEERDETFFVNNEPAENSFNEQDLNSIESELTEEFKEVKHSKTRRMLKIGGIISIVICVLLIIIVPTTVILTAKTTAVASSTSSADVTATTSASTTTKPTVIPSSTPAASANTGFPTDTSTTMPISHSTSSTKSTMSPSTTEISTSTTLVTPVLSTTTSYETTTVSVVEKVDECEYMNELLEIDICRLDVGYPLNHCNKNDEGCYKVQGKCVHSIYMDWTLCVDYFGWEKCEDDETEEPELIVDWCKENN